MQKLIYFGNMMYQARTQHCMSKGDLIKVLKEVHKIDITENQIDELENNQGNYEYLIDVLAKVYRADASWLYQLYEQTPRG